MGASNDDEQPPVWRLIDPLPDGSWLYHPLTRRAGHMYLADSDAQKRALVRFHARTRSLGVMVLLGAGLSVVLVGGIAGGLPGYAGALCVIGLGVAQHWRERRALLSLLHPFLDG
jgi:hypothetical protein